MTAVTVTTAGTGYTFNYIRNEDIVSAGGGLSGAELDVIIEQKGGHGKNGEELGGFFVMLNTNFEETQDLQIQVTLQQQTILEK